MAGINEHTIEKEGSVLVFYRCSKCGQNILVNHKIQESESYQRSAYKKASNTDPRRTAAENKLNAKLEKKRAQFIENADKHEFSVLKFKCQCSKCGHYEDWNRYEPAKLEKWMDVLVLLCILSAVCAAIGFVPWPIFVSLLSVIIQLAIINAIINSAVDKHVKKMDRKNLPIAAADLNTLNEKISAVFPGESIYFQQ